MRDATMSNSASPNRERGCVHGREVQIRAHEPLFAAAICAGSTSTPVTSSSRLSAIARAAASNPAANVQIAPAWCSIDSVQPSLGVANSCAGAAGAIDDELFNPNHFHGFGPLIMGVEAALPSFRVAGTNPMNEALRHAIRKAEFGDEIHLVIERHAKPLEFDVSLTAPSSPMPC